MKSNSIIYSVARKNGNIVYLNDTDVSMKFTLSIITYSRNETGHITGFKIIVLILIIIIVMKINIILIHLL